MSAYTYLPRLGIGLFIASSHLARPRLPSINLTNIAEYLVFPVPSEGFSRVKSRASS